MKKMTPEEIVGLADPTFSHEDMKVTSKDFQMWKGMNLKPETLKNSKVRSEFEAFLKANP